MAVNRYDIDSIDYDIYKFGVVNQYMNKDIVSLRENLFAEDYTNGLNRDIMVSKYGIKWSSCIVRASRMGLSRNYTKERKYNLNENYFESIDSQEKAYILGLFFADGCNHTEINMVSLSLANHDKHIFSEIQNLIDSNYPLTVRECSKKFKNRQDCFILSICSKQFSADLNKLGMIKNKKFSTVYPKIDKKYNSSFIRGYFDGDGCISSKKDLSAPTFSIVGNYAFVEKIQSILMEEVFLNKTAITVCKKNNITATVSYGGINSVKKIYDYLYKEDTISFNRKKKKFETIFKRYNI